MRAIIGEIISRAKFIIEMLCYRGSNEFCLIEPQIAQAPRELSDITDIWNDPVYFAVPKKRITIERRRFRKFLSYHMDKYKLRNDLIACQYCGCWHPKTSICVRCYDEVRRETNALKESLGTVREGLPFDQEAHFIYSQETFGKVGAFVHKVNRKRPSWFPENLLSLPPKK